MSVQDILNYAVIDGGQAPTNAASATGDHGQMLLYAMAELAKISGTTNISPTVDANGSMAERLAYLQQLTPLGSGIVRNMRDWMGGVGYEYWFGAAQADLTAAASATNPSGLDGWGWGGLSSSSTLTGDLLSTTTPGGHWFNPASGVPLVSPRIFGGAEHAQTAAQFLGQAPTTINLEFWGKWNNVATNTYATYIAGLTSGNVAADAAGSAGAICSDGTNFRLVTDSAVSGAGPAVDTNWHKFRIEVTVGSQTSWYVDDNAQPTILSVEAGIWPLSMVSRRDAAGNNFSLYGGRVYYAL